MIPIRIYMKHSVYSRFYFLTRSTGELYFSASIYLAPEGSVRGPPGRKIERIQFLSWFADFITPLHTVSYIRSRAPRTFCRRPSPWFEGSFSTGLSWNESGDVGCQLERFHPTKRSLSHDRDTNVGMDFRYEWKTKGWCRSEERWSDLSLPAGELSLEASEKNEGKLLGSLLGKLVINFYFQKDWKNREAI